jgi:hypothetical protein
MMFLHYFPAKGALERDSKASHLVLSYYTKSNAPNPLVGHEGSSNVIAAR